MKMKNFINRLGLLGLSAALSFSLSSCNGGDDRVASDGVYEEEVIDNEEVLADENDRLPEEESELVTVANEGYYETWDLDKDDRIEGAEWEEGWNLYLTEEDYDGDRFNEWDLDGDAYLNQEEFAAGYYTNFDADDDKVWNEDEFNKFTTTSYYDSWDMDGNDEIAENEFEKGWNTYMAEAGYNYDADLYTEWDADGDNSIEDEEFAEGMFGYWDADDSGYIEEPEFTTYHTL